MAERIPDNSNRLAYIIGLFFHPLVIFVPALAIVLKDTPWKTALIWIGVIAALILVPSVILFFRLKQRGRFTYERGIRGEVYFTFAAVMVISISLAIVFDAPRRLLASLLSLLIWIPIQTFINSAYTKISTHTAVVSGIMAAFWIMGELDHILLKIGAVIAVASVGWARVVTKNHTLIQVILGIIVSVSAVLIAFSIVKI